MKKEGNNWLRNIKIITAVLLLVVAMLSGYFMITSPVAFQKSVAIRFVNITKIMVSEPKSYINIQEILHRIPYKKNGGMVYEVRPKRKYIETIEKGYGNCSNLAFGLGYHLGKLNHEYQIVHLMPPDGFLNGLGHTVVNIPYVINGKNNYGIVDVLEGGLPQNEGVFFDITSLRKGGFNNPLILPLNPNKDEHSDYYKEFLDDSIIGVIKSEEVNVYFNYLENIYVPLGNKKLEKILYDGVSIVFGYYPSIYVLEDDSGVLFKNNKATRVFAYALLISIRLFLFLSVLVGAVHIFTVISSHITRGL